MDWCLELLLWNYTGSGTVGDPNFYMMSLTNSFWQHMTSELPHSKSNFFYLDPEKNEEYIDDQESYCISQLEEESCCEDESLTSFDDHLSREKTDCFQGGKVDPEPDLEFNNEQEDKDCAVCLGLKYNNNTGSLDVTIMECRELPVAAMKKQQLNPYVKSYLSFAHTKYGKKKTRTMPGSTNPKFHEIFRDSELMVAAWHHNKYGRNFCIGQTIIRLEDFCFGEPFPRWYKLEQTEGKMHHPCFMML